MFDVKIETFDPEYEIMDTDNRYTQQQHSPILSSNHSSPSADVPQLDAVKVEDQIVLPTMDLPGTSSSPNGLVQLPAIYNYQPSISPPELPMSHVAAANLILQAQLHQMMPIKSDYLNKSESSAFTCVKFETPLLNTIEVNDLRKAVNMILPLLPVYNHSLPQHLNQTLAAGLAQSQIQTILNQNFLRNGKRISPHSPSVQPECPVSMQTVLNQPGSLQNTLFLNNWLLPIRNGTSPTIPTANLAAMSFGDSQIPNGDDQTTKWGSPSSVDSNGQKTDSSTASPHDANIDIVGDGSESSTSSASAQDPLAMYNAVQSAQSLAHVLKSDGTLFFQNVPQPADVKPIVIPQAAASSNGNNRTNSGGPERKPRKPVNDDIVKIVRQKDLSAETIAHIEIPVPEAVSSDPGFRAIDEKQIIAQIMQSKKFEETEVGECMIQLCKKLAEKRVFGPRLMSQTTVAGLNHSNYSNLPIEGICYIQHVCWKELRSKFSHEEDFWDKFRDAMRKLAARCRRVRHAKKTKNNREESMAQQAAIAKRENTSRALSSSLSQTIEILGLNGVRPRAEGGYESILPNLPSGTDLSSLTIGQLGQLVLQNLQEKSMKNLSENDNTIVQTFLRLATTCPDFQVKQEPQSSSPE